MPFPFPLPLPLVGFRGGEVMVPLWRLAPSSGSNKQTSVLLESLAELSKSSVDPALDRGQRLVGEPRDLGRGQVGPVSKCYCVALLRGQRGQGPHHEVAILEEVDSARSLTTLRGADALQGALLRRPAPAPVAQEIESDRVEP